MTIALISHPDCLLHDPGIMHPESSKRLQVIHDALINSDLSSHFILEEAPLVSFEALQRVHPKNYIDLLYSVLPTSGKFYIDADTVLSPGTLNAARYAAGSVVRAVDLVLTDKVKLAFCNIRPPGHHATASGAMGFCFFNNVAVGVLHALVQYNLKRILIVDFDIHRGNGTESIFKNNPQVLICSIYEKDLYPGFESPLSPSIISIPLPSSSTSKTFREKINKSVLTKMINFNPELIFFSAGFDGHQEDVISSANLVEADYFWISQKIKKIADQCSKGRMISVLEGGYALNVLGQSVLAHIQGITKPNRDCQ